MGDAGEGLVDNESRIQERMEELKAERANAKRPPRKNPEVLRQIESLTLARTQLSNQLQTTSNEARRTQIQKALSDLEKQIEELQSKWDK